MKYLSLKLIVYYYFRSRIYKFLSFITSLLKNQEREIILNIIIKRDELNILISNLKVIKLNDELN